MEHTIGQFLKWASTAIFIVLLVTITAMLYNTNQVNSFQTQAVQILQRSGGLTPAAHSKIQSLSKKNYHNFFTIQTSTGKSSSGAVDYGEPINYKIQTRIPYSKKGVIVATSTGTTDSEVRKDSQPLD